MVRPWRLVGDSIHALAVFLYLVIVGVKGNSSGVSMKSHMLYLMVFMARYLDVFTTFYSWYNTIMKVYFIAATLAIITIIKNVEPAKSTYSPAQDRFPHWILAAGAALFGMMIHLIGSGVVDIKGGSGQEFEVHFEHYSWLSFLWTFSVCLEPLAMIPQLYIFFKNRLLSANVRWAMFCMGTYRIFYIVFWVFRAQKVDQNAAHHYLLYISGFVQVFMYADFFIYHWSVFMLCCLSKYGSVLGDSGSMVTDSGIETWALTATGKTYEDFEKVESSPKEKGWTPGDKPASKKIEMRKLSGLGVV